jgi:hypothetical protein
VQWLTSDAILRSLAAGSLAVLLLVPDETTIPTVVAKCGDCLTPDQDGATDTRTVFALDAIGLSSLASSGTAIARTFRDSSVSLDVSDLPALLRSSNGLPIETLATLVGVTKVTYHKWLNGSGIAEDSQQRLRELAVLLPTLRTFRPDLRAFLATSTRLGTPLDLLAERRDSLVVGLASRRAGLAPHMERTPRVGLRKVRPLGGSRALDRDKLEDFAPRLIAETPFDPYEEGEPITAGSATFG